MGGGRRLEVKVEVEVEVEVCSFVGYQWFDASLVVWKASSVRGGLLVFASGKGPSFSGSLWVFASGKGSSFSGSLWVFASGKGSSFFMGGLWVYASLEVVGASSFIGLGIFVCVCVIGLVAVITDTGLCVIISCALAMQTLLWSGGQTWLCSDGQIWFWSDGQGWNSIQV